MSHNTALSRRLRPLYLASALQMVGLWVPIEKLFMSEIGFDAASVGIMAAAYAAIVPILEVPSGILADRWSRRGVLIVASAAGFGSALIGGLSYNVLTYIVSAMVLGVFFAMHSGTGESIVYDTVVEETGSSELFEKCIGRVRMMQSIALVSSSLIGGVLAQLTTPRLTYFLELPFLAASVLVLLRLREPTLHQSAEKTSLRGHLTVTFRALTASRRLLPIAALAVLAALLQQVIFEFGPLWLVALAAPAVLYGPFTAGMTSTFGLGGLLAGRFSLDRRGWLTTLVGTLVVASLLLTSSNEVMVITIAQMSLLLVLMIASVYVTRRLHDAVPSEVRTGVASGVSALSWIVFLPLALVFGTVSKAHGVHSAGWLIVAAAAVAGALLIVIARPETVVAQRDSAPEPALVGSLTL